MSKRRKVESYQARERRAVESYRLKVATNPDEPDEHREEARALLAMPNDPLEGVKEYLGTVNDGPLAVLSKMLRMEPVSMPEPAPDLPEPAPDPAPEPEPVVETRPADWPDDFVPTKEFPQPMRPKPRVVVEGGNPVPRSEGAAAWSAFAGDLAAMRRNRR